MAQEKFLSRLLSFTVLFLTLSLASAHAAMSVSCTLPSAQAGAAYTGASCTATGGTAPYNYSISLGALPANLVIAPTTGAISGTPTMAGTYSFTVSATDSASTPQTATHAVASFVVAPATLTLGCTFPTTAQVNVAYTGASCTAVGGTTPYTYSLVGAPSWMSISATTGAISGTPTAAATTSFSVKVTDSGSQTATFAVTSFVVAPATLTLTCTFPATAQVNVAYTGASCTAGGGTTPYTYSLVGAPAWMSISATTGAISGTPTSATTASFSVKVTDSESTPQSKTYAVTSFVVAPATLTLNCTFPTTAQVNVAYTGASCTAAGGTTPYTYSLVGAPAWMSVSTTTGAISGTPTAALTTSFSVKATDSASQTATFAVTSFVVAPATLTLSCTFPATAQVNVAYTGASCTAAGGTTPYTYSLVGAPAWMSISATTGAISGTPTAATTTSFSVKVTDSASQTATFAVASFIVAPATLTLSCTFPATAQVNVAYTGASCTAAGGTTPYTYSLVGAPAWMSISATTGAISGTPTTAATTSFSVKVTDSASQTATFAVTSFVVAPATLTLNCTFPPTAEINVAYTGASCTAGGGTPAYTYSLTGSYPAGLSISSTTGVISGAPTASGTFSFTVKVADSGTQTATSLQTSFVVAGALTLSCTAATQSVQGASYSGSCNTTGGLNPITLSQSGTLPTGVSFNASTGAISGSTSAAGTFTFTIKATDADSQAASKSITVTVYPVLTITTTTLPSGIAGISYSASCAASGGNGTNSYSVSAGALPTGLSLNASTCAITGPPSASGTFNFSITASDTETTPQTYTQPLSITISPALTITSTTVPNGSTNLAYSSLLAAQNGTQPYSWSYTGNLPPGLNLNSAGLISGTPNTTGSYTFTAKVTDSGSPQQSATKSFTISISAGLTITTTSLANGIVNSSYSAALSAQNGTAPYTWSLASGSLPGGLSINGSSITGTPNSAATFAFTVKVVDSGSPQQTATQALTITIAPVLTLNTGGFPNGTVGVAYSGSCSVSGGTGTLSYVVASGSLPSGLILNTTNCNLTGIPASGTANAYNFTIKVTDQGSPQQTATQSFSFTIGAGLTITSNATLPAGTIGQTYSYTLTAQNGTAPYTWANTSGTPPPGLTPNGNGAITGTPTTTGTYTFTMKVIDSESTPQTASQTFTLVVNPATLTLRL